MSAAAVRISMHRALAALRRKLRVALPAHWIDTSTGPRPV
jgi:hypothetical protein